MILIKIVENPMAYLRFVEYAQIVYLKKYYTINKEKHKQNTNKRNKKIYEENRKKIKEIKLASSCQICGEIEPCCLDFHHIDQNKKEYAISSMATWSWDTIKKEIEKCIIVCSNCHRKIHAG